jgi:dihydroorotate dehydrogenase electron transfer subunit
VDSFRHAHPGIPLLIAEDAGIGPIILHAERLRDLRDTDRTPLVLLGTQKSFPFQPRPSLIVVPGMPDGVIACMPLLDSWGIASRLANLTDSPGCFAGTVTDLARRWVETLAPAERRKVQIAVSGADNLEKSVALLTQQQGLRPPRPIALAPATSGAPGSDD